MKLDEITDITDHDTIKPYYDLGYGQGDHLGFDGWFKYKDMSISLKQHGRHYYPSNIYVEEVYSYGDEDEPERNDEQTEEEYEKLLDEYQERMEKEEEETGEELLEILRDIMNDAKKYGYNIVEWYWDEDNCIEEMNANEYEFLVDGKNW